MDPLEELSRTVQRVLLLKKRVLHSAAPIVEYVAKNPGLLDTIEDLSPSSRLRLQPMLFESLQLWVLK